MYNCQDEDGKDESTEKKINISHNKSIIKLRDRNFSKKMLIKVLSVLGCYAVSTGKQLPTFRRSVLSPSLLSSWAA